MTSPGIMVYVALSSSPVRWACLLRDSLTIAVTSIVLEISR